MKRMKGKSTLELPPRQSLFIGLNQEKAYITSHGMDLHVKPEHANKAKLTWYREHDGAIFSV